MRLCRYATPEGIVHPGLSLDGETVLDLSVLGKRSLEEILEAENPQHLLESIADSAGEGHRLSDVKLLTPVERQEVWAAGVTYLRSRTARTDESHHDATAYDRVYEAERPELFFKAAPHKVVGPGDPVGIRSDSRWSVPEPELALVINSRGSLVGCTIGNDMSARDIEGANLLYLPQAKIYDRSCAIGPWIGLGLSEERVRTGQVRLQIVRDGRNAFVGETSLDHLQRPFDNLIRHLFRSQTFPHGAILLTGTGIVPPEDFTLRSGDVIHMEITDLGALHNPVVTV